MKCKECFDTGCSCGGIGLTCHGCCFCESGNQSRDNRKKALEEVSKLLNTWDDIYKL